MIKARFTFEVVGNPKDFVQNFSKKLIEDLKKLDYLEIKKIENPEPIEREVGKDKKVKMFSTFIEVEGEFKDLDSLFNFILDFSPSTIEILDPEKFEIKNFELNKYLNDISHRIINLMLLYQDLYAKYMLKTNQYK